MLRQANKAGAKLGKPAGKVGERAGSRLGRGHVAARFAGQGLGVNARRVTIKARLVNLAQAWPRSTAAHLRYIEREGVDRHGGPGHAYGPATDAADLEVFKERDADDRHPFSLVGRVAGKGLADELYDKGYLIVDGTDGKAHYVALPPRSELEQYLTGAVVAVKGAADVRAADRNITALAVDGVYRMDHPGRRPRSGHARP